MTSSDPGTPVTDIPWWQRIPQVPTSMLSKPTLLIEVLVVLAVFPLTSTLTAVFELIQELVGVRVGGGSLPFPTPGNPTLGAALSTVYSAASIVAAPGLVWYLLRRDGGGLGSLGLDRTQIVRDLAIAVPLYLAARYANHIGGLLPYPSASVGGAYAKPELPWSQAGYLIARAFRAGIVEEIVVLGFLTTRLRQMRVPLVAVLTISLVVRASYHLEYGFAAIGPVLFGLVATAFYLKTRRLLPVIVMHIVVDIAIVFSLTTLV